MMLAKETARQEHHIKVAEDGKTVLDWLASQTALSKQRIKQTLDKGAVWLTHGNHTQRIRRAKRMLPQGDTLHLYYDEAVLQQQPPVPQLIADEGDYSLWYKPCGMLSQGSKWGDHCTINRWVEKHHTPQRPAFIVHRLDRAATGLILIAHSKQAAKALSARFENRKMEKRYQAIVHGACSVNQPPKTIEDSIDGRQARSHVRCLHHDADLKLSLLEIEIETGRKHQIRRHLASIGYPIVGDRLYGVGGETEDLQLTACYLQFICPLSNQERHYALPENLKPKLEN
ncbi:MAG: RluA family pseudouridine synthase [Sedimenticola sp.]|nr:RluA family pseudouridine synthase [Sedimenticola sp.]